MEIMDSHVNMPQNKNEIIALLELLVTLIKLLPSIIAKNSSRALLQQNKKMNKLTKLKVKQRFIYRWINVSKYQNPQLDSELVEEANRLNINLANNDL